MTWSDLVLVISDGAWICFDDGATQCVSVAVREEKH